MKLSLLELKLAINMTYGYDSIDLLKTFEVADGKGQIKEVFLFQIDGDGPAFRCFIWEEQTDGRSISAPTIIATSEIDTAEKALACHRMRVMPATRNTECNDHVHN